MDWAKIEKFSEKMKKWHNRLYKFACIGIFILFSDVVGLGILGWSNSREYLMGLAQSAGDPLPFIMYDILIYVGGPVLMVFICYTILFTQFFFPIQFKGGGGGHKIKPPWARQ